MYHALRYFSCPKPLVYLFMQYPTGFLCVSNNIIYLFIYFASATELTCNHVVINRCHMQFFKVAWSSVQLYCCTKRCTLKIPLKKVKLTWLNKWSICTAEVWVWFRPFPMCHCPSLTANFLVYYRLLWHKIQATCIIVMHCFHVCLKRLLMTSHLPEMLLQGF